MIGFQALAGLFAILMLVRHLPRALAFLSPAARRRTGADGRAAGSILDLASVLLAAAVLGFSVKALASALISHG